MLLGNLHMSKMCQVAACIAVKCKYSQPFTCAVSQEIRSIIESNAANKAAGKQLLHKLPLQQKLAARLRSWLLLLTIYATLWVGVNDTFLHSI